MSDFERKFRRFFHKSFGNYAFNSFLHGLAAASKMLVFVALIMLFFILILNPSGLIAFVTMLLVLAVLGLVTRY